MGKRYLLLIPLFASMACGSSSSTEAIPSNPPTETPIENPTETPTDPPESSGDHFTYGGCPQGFECTETELCGPEGCVPKAQIGWKDTNDGGDDPMVAGCHWFYYNDPACAGDPRFYSGDSCDGVNLHEYTDSTCHQVPPNDEKTYDCDAHCKKLGFPSGTCAVVPNACGDGQNSARCECERVVEP